MNHLHNSTDLKLRSIIGTAVCLCVTTIFLTGCVILPQQREEPTEVYYITSPVTTDQNYI